MPNGDLSNDTRKYGGHEYPDHSLKIVECKFDCGCSVGPNHAAGRIGIDPFGECPNNPVDGIRLNGEVDYLVVAERRVRNLETRALRAESLLEEVRPTKKQLAARLSAAQRELDGKNWILDNIRSLLGNEKPCITQHD